MPACPAHSTPGPPSRYFTRRKLPVTCSVRAILAREGMGAHSYPIATAEPSRGPIATQASANALPTVGHPTIDVPGPQPHRALAVRILIRNRPNENARNAVNTTNDATALPRPVSPASTAPPPTESSTATNPRTNGAATLSGRSPQERTAATNVQGALALDAPALTRTMPSANCTPRSASMTASISGPP